MKICPVEAELFNADGGTDRQTDSYDETKSRFSQFFERVYERYLQEWGFLMTVFTSTSAVSLVT
jgi:hypothetical protein